MSRWFLACLLPWLAAAPARAADGAALDVIGYSPDARYFAFQQYGHEGGSGAPWWEIVIVDLEKDALVDGSPFRARIDDAENAVPLSAARARAMERAAAVLSGLNITEPAEILAANPATEVVAERGRITFDRGYVAMGSTPSGDSEIRHDLRLTTVALPRPRDCAAENGEVYGFILTLTDRKLGTSHAIHTDKAIAGLRGCPVGYDLSGVAAPAGYSDTDRLVALVGVYGQGREGADHTFIAVPFVLSD
jgi:predicted secreted protein